MLTPTPSPWLKSLVPPSENLLEYVLLCSLFFCIIWSWNSLFLSQNYAYYALFNICVLPKFSISVLGYLHNKIWIDCCQNQEIRSRFFLTVPRIYWIVIFFYNLPHVYPVDVEYFSRFVTLKAPGGAIYDTKEKV